MLIRISGSALVFRDDDGDLDEPDLLEQLNGLESPEVCSDYMDDDLADLGIIGGSVKLVHVGGEEFRVVTEYRSPSKLDDQTVERLAQTSLGQWSDGIGENGFYEVQEALGVSINLSPLEQEASVRVEQIDDGQFVPSPNILAKAAREGDLALLKSELAAGADVERRLQGYTPLHLAVLYGRANTALELIAQGADVHALDPLGEDALMQAALSNSISDEDAALVARALLEKSAPANGFDATDQFPLATRQKPLEAALGREKLKLAAILRSYGAT
jgi:hypothetical protein